MNNLSFKTVKNINLILLGLVMLIPGLAKLFIMTPSGFAGALAGWGFPIPVFLAWIVALTEVIFGIAILARWQLKYTVWPPAIILIVAAFTAHLPPFESITAFIGGMGNMLVHLAIATNYLMYGLMPKK